MKEVFEKLLKELNRVYPKSIPIRILQNQGYEMSVLLDVEKNGLVDSETVPELDENGIQVAKHIERALKINLKGIEFLDKVELKKNGITHKGDTNIKVDGKGNIIALGQSGSTVNVDTNIQSKPHLLPYSGFEYGFINIGRWLMKRIYGSLEHDIKWFIIVTSILTIITGYPFVNSVYIKSILNFSQPLIIFDTIAFVIVLIVGWGFIISSKETQCPNCNKKFAYTRKSRVLDNRVDLPEKEVRNYKSSYSCDFCNFTKENVQEIEEIEKNKL